MPKSFDKEEVLGPVSSKFVEEVLIPLYPKLEIKLKTKPDWIYRLASFFGTIFNPDLDKTYLTVIGKTIWVPESFREKPDVSKLSSMMHEGTHQYDSKRLTPIPYFLLYASPQILAVLTLLSFGAFYDLFWLLWLLCLLWLLPFPSPGRAWVEHRGYQLNMMMARKGFFDIPGSVEHYKKQFTGPAYWWMWPFPAHVERKLMERLEETDPWIKKLSEWVDANRLAL
jgi:hypothetical protein